MSSFLRSAPVLAALAFLFPLSSTHVAAASDGPDPYYTVPTYFFPKPDSRGAAWKVPNFGPVGVGLNLVKPNFTMQITKVEKGSPADKTGKLKPGQIIESVNGKVMKDQDPRILLADWITEAEATDGKMLLKIKGAGDVLVQIPVLGRYSPTWPENCAKSDKIVRNLADRIAQQKSTEWGAVMFLLSTGEEKDLDVVKKWMKDIKTVGPYPWHKPEHAKDIIPPMADLFGRTRIGRILLFSRDFEKSISKADKQVQTLAMPYFKKAFDAVPREFIDPTTGYVMGGGAHYARNKLAIILLNLPGGSDVGRTDPKITLKSAISGKDEDMYVFSGKYAPDKTMAGKWLKKIEIMPGKLGALEEAIAKESAALAKLDENFKTKQAKKASNPNAKKKKKKPKSPLQQKTYLELLTDGRVGTGKMLFWTDTMLIDNSLGEARAMKLHTLNGKTYLLVEKGGFIPAAAAKEDGEEDADATEADAALPDDGSSSETRPPGWHCGYLVYERA